MPTTIKRGRWCPRCATERTATNLRLTIEQMQTVAKKRGGKCLSKRYVNAHTEPRWRCAEGHEWESVSNSVKDQGTWCPTCAGHAPLTIADMRALGRERGGACLSTEYVNARSKLQWRCRKGHEWQAMPYSIKGGGWCPLCANVRARPERSLTIDQMQAEAKKHGGTCLSTKYVSSHAKLQSRCDEGHEWEATPGSIKNGSWCETCATGSSERIARDVFEQMFSTPFPKRRPKWLINSRGHQMELDGYSKTLSLGFEYQGIQHYKETMSFHRGGQNVARQKRNDTRKQKLCRAHGVDLIAIPYTVIPADMPAYIFRTVKKRGLKLSMRQQKTIKVAQVRIAKEAS